VQTWQRLGSRLAEGFDFTSPFVAYASTALSAYSLCSTHRSDFLAVVQKLEDSYFSSLPDIPKV
jgi:hypothetical protein